MIVAVFCYFVLGPCLAGGAGVGVQNKLMNHATDQWPQLVCCFNCFTLYRGQRQIVRLKSGHSFHVSSFLIQLTPAFASTSSQG